MAVSASRRHSSLSPTASLPRSTTAAQRRDSGPRRSAARLRCPAAPAGRPKLPVSPFGVYASPRLAAALPGLPSGRSSHATHPPGSRSSAHRSVATSCRKLLRSLRILKHCFLFRYLTRSVIRIMIPILMWRELLARKARRNNPIPIAPRAHAERIKRIPAVPTAPNLRRTPPPARRLRFPPTLRTKDLSSAHSNLCPLPLNSIPAHFS
jgi:hypothetical protein